MTEWILKGKGNRMGNELDRHNNLLTPTESDEMVRYNGWENRETWALVLHLQNDQGLYADTLCIAREALDELDDTQRKLRNLSRARVGRAIIEWVDGDLREWAGNAEWYTNLRRDVGSFWRINEIEVGEAFLEALHDEVGSHSAYAHEQIEKETGMPCPQCQKWETPDEQDGK